jgi:hypothetical protein
VRDWFEHSLRPMCVPIHLAETCPPLAEKIPHRTQKEALAGFGIARTLPDLNRDLALVLPPGFPLDGVHEENRAAIVQSSCTPMTDHI